MLELRVVARQRLVHGQIQQHPVVVLAQLRLGLFLAHLGIDGSYPVFRFLLRFERRRRMEARNGINPAFKNRSGTMRILSRSLKVTRFFSTMKARIPLASALTFAEKLIRLHVVLIDAVNHFGNDLVLERVSSSGRCDRHGLGTTSYAAAGRPRTYRCEPEADPAPRLRALNLEFHACRVRGRRRRSSRKPRVRCAS